MDYDDGAINILIGIVLQGYVGIVGAIYQNNLTWGMPVCDEGFENGRNALAQGLCSQMGETKDPMEIRRLIKISEELTETDQNGEE